MPGMKSMPNKYLVTELHLVYGWALRLELQEGRQLTSTCGAAIVLPIISILPTGAYQMGTKAGHKKERMKAEERWQVQVRCCT
jgi:hypothetical protein